MNWFYINKHVFDMILQIHLIIFYNLFKEQDLWRYLIITLESYIIDFYFKNEFIVNFIILYIGSNDDVADDCGVDECEVKMDTSTISGKNKIKNNCVDLRLNTNIFLDFQQTHLNYLVYFHYIQQKNYYQIIVKIYISEQKLIVCYMLQN